MPHVIVRILRGYSEPLTYHIPDHLIGLVHEGSFVRVPLRQKEVVALVHNIFDAAPENISYRIRDIIALEAVPRCAHYGPFIDRLARYYALEPLMLYQRIRSFLGKEYQDAVGALSQEINEALPVTLTDEQQAVVDYVAPLIAAPVYQATLIHGVTGCGKTEVYKRLLKTCIEQEKTALLLLPEVSLAVQFVALLRRQLPEITILGFHSASSAAEKKTLWQTLIQKKPVVIVGVHLPILLPIPHLGLIVIDEEHDNGYQEKKHPHINTKEAALLRAHVAGIPIVLGSATPSITSLYNVEHRGWRLFEITRRFSGAFPVVKVVALRSDRKRENFWISTDLQQALEECLAKKEQAIIFLNRRGYSFFVQCKECGFIVTCASCSVSLTLHENDVLQCHYCGHREAMPTCCAGCAKNSWLKKGIGTQQVVSILEKMFPAVRIARADVDATVNKKKWQATIEKFSSGEIDILVGTQTITKGYHFPRVTLVGILWADSNVHIPVYHAAESTLQQIIQVAGRAGRTRPDSKVIVQTMQEYPLLSYINEIRYKDFYAYELAHRQELGYPPCQRIADIELRGEDEGVVEAESLACADFLQYYMDQSPEAAVILGPAQPPVHKIKNIFMRKIYLKGPSFGVMLAAYHSLMASRSWKSSLLFTPQPLF